MKPMSKLVKADVDHAHIRNYNIACNCFEATMELLHTCKRKRLTGCYVRSKD